MGETDRQEGHATTGREGVEIGPMKRTGRKRRERRAQRAEAAKAATSPQPTQVEDSRGLGAPVAEHGNETLVKNQRMEGRALLEQWPIKEQYREPLVNGQVMIALDPKQEPRHRTRAFMALLAANKQNMEASGHVATAATTNVSVNVGVQVTDSLREALDHDPEYLKFLERKILDGDAVDVGQNGRQQLSDAAAHPPTEHGSNGHTNGNGWHPPLNGHDAAAPREK